MALGGEEAVSELHAATLAQNAVDRVIGVPHGAGVRGRPPGDPYAVLGLAPGATAADVQRAYRRRARLLHPDVAGEGGTSRMAELNLARDAVLAQLRPANGSG